jgi:RNA polymerase sigma-70 factor (ECF subfamily)
MSPQPPSDQPPDLSSQLFRPGGHATPEWWPRFVTLYAPVVRRWALRAGVSTQDADDLVQQVCVDVCRGIGTFQRELGSFTAWVYTIAQRRVIDCRRRQRGQPEAVGGTDFLERMQREPAPDESAPAGLPPEALPPLVRRALDLVRGEFEPRTWQAFWLVVVEEKTTADAAATLGLSPAAVRQAKSRVLRRLRAVLECAERTQA